MISRKKSRVLVKAQDIRPSGDKMTVAGVFNPAAIRVSDEICLLARVAETVAETKKGFIPSLRYDFSGVGPQLITGWIPEKPSPAGPCRRHISHLRLIKLDSTGFKVTHIDEVPAFFPDCDYEEHGIEDPRLVKIRESYYFTYGAVSGDSGTMTALASTGDFCSYQREGVIFCRENKHAAILPEKFQGRYCVFHSPEGETGAMMAAFSKNLTHWGEHRAVMASRPHSWDSGRIFPGTVPIRTDKGWLLIYRALQLNSGGKGPSICRTGAAMFDLEDPSLLIGRSKEPLLEPGLESDAKISPKSALFPTGAVTDLDEKHVLLFCGAADSTITVIKLSLSEILESMEPIE